ncbi:MAG: major facilitator superfamily 1 [Frankiales bacterium]|nr:major facilitator superfamily 1 [Frankiales bacterium]
MSPAITTTFRSLKVRNYRLFAGGQVVSLSGTWAQRVAQDWLVLELSHNSGVALGITIGLQFLPMLLFGLYGGVLADRYDKRALLVGAQVAMGLLALALGLLDVTGVVQLWQVYALAFLLGLASVIDTPVRQAFVVEMVGPADLPNAVSLNSATFNVSRILGPAIAGVAISRIGTAPVFLANAASYVAVVVGLLAIRRADLFDAHRVARAKGQLREGLAYVRSDPQLYVPIALIAVIGTFGLNFQLTLALIAKQTFHMGAGSYGALSAMLATGSLFGALASARRSTVPSARFLYGSALAFGVCEVLTGLAPSYAVMAVLLVPTGAAVLTFTTTANATVQLTSAPHMRGRVMSLYVLVFLGGTPFGAPVIGAVAEVLGPRSSLLIGGLLSAAAAVVAGVYVRRATATAAAGSATRALPLTEGATAVARTTGPRSPLRTRSRRRSPSAPRTARR